MKKRNSILFTGKKAFSLMEVIIAVTLLSVVMISLFKIKSNNIFILQKAPQEEKNKEYLSMAIDSKPYNKRNENIYLSRLFNIQDDDLRKELKQVKIKVKDETLDTKDYKNNELLLTITSFKTSYSLENGIKKDIYKFKLEL
jgi:prepilin-type N-terminal cleavage/methylation domain-containing protein